MLVPLQGLTGIVEESLDAFVRDIAGAIPKILAGVVFLVLAYVLVRSIMFVVNQVARRTFRGEDVYQQFVTTLIKVFLWFGVALSFLSVVGLDDIAASLGTATGFLALGVSYAVSGMIADAVAGIYLLRDPDFMPGDTVLSDGTEGVIEDIELRKTRISVGDDTVVLGNAAIEKKWTKRDDVDREGPETEPTTEDGEGAETEERGAAAGEGGGSITEAEQQAEAEGEASAKPEGEAEAEAGAEAGTGGGSGEGTEGERDDTTGDRTETDEGRTDG
jgi:hypothetical protein